MATAYVGMAAFSSLLLVISALGKLRRTPYIVKSVHEQAQVPLRWFPYLAGLEFAAAAGLLAGIACAPLGVAAAAGMTMYFGGAVAAHLRVADVKGSAPALQMLCIAAVGLVARVLSL